MAKQPDNTQPFQLVAQRVMQHLETSGSVAQGANQHLETSGYDGARRHVEERLPAEQVNNINAVLGSRSVSYRDVLIVQLAYKIASDQAGDLTVRHAGARTVGKMLGQFFAAHHIPSVQDAYQNIGKNSTNLARGNFPEFDSFLRWATTEKTITNVQIEAAFDYVCAAVAITARPVLPMPPLDRGTLTFGSLSRLLRDLFDLGSQGAYEQFAIASLLSALVEQTGSQQYRVETKSLNASDKSSRAAGDIQIMTGNRVVEAYEVTANDWETKLPGAEKTVKDHDLTRIHIVASIRTGADEQVLRKLDSQAVDVSVLNLREFAVSLASVLTRSFRAHALERMYEYLDRYQPDVGRVNRYVRMIESLGLNERAG